MTVKVTGVDDDDDPDLWVNQLDTTGKGLWPPTLPTLGSGSNSFYEWASRQDNVGVDFSGKDEENRTVPFMLDAKFPQKVDLHFQVKGKVESLTRSPPGATRRPTGARLSATGGTRPRSVRADIRSSR